MRLPLTVVLVVLAGFVSGCITEDAPDAAPDPPRERSDSDDPTDVDPRDVVPPTPRTMTTTPVGLEGLTSQGAWACTDDTGNSGCIGQELIGGGYVVAQAYEGTLDAFDLNVSWAMLDPTLENMIVVFGVRVGGVDVYGPHVHEASSVLRLQGTGLDLGPDGSVWLALWPAAEAKTPAAAVFVDVQRQPFAVEGTLSTWSDPGSAR